MNTEYNFDDYQKDALEKPRDKAWENWAKFENVGDKVQGFVRDVFHRPGEGQFPTQRGLTLEQTNGELINVGIKHVDFILKRTDNVRLGDPLTIVFEKELQPSVKGHNPTKVFGYYSQTLPANAGNKTVKQLELEDQNIAEAEAAQEAANAEAEMANLTGEAKAADPVATAEGQPFGDEVKPVEPVAPVAPVEAEPAQAATTSPAEQPAA